MGKTHLIGNAHIDPVWLWRWQDGFAEIKATFRSALDRMKEFDDFIFTSACGAYYMWIEKSDPKMFEEIRERVREGRWCITGGWFLQPDCNIPSGESFARHALISQNYFIEKFGKPAETGYNVDSFGHNGSLPKILRASRMNNYVFMRPARHEKSLPANLFAWESADGSRVGAYRIPICYNICFKGKEDPVHVFGEVGEMAKAGDQMAFYGVGNHGGGPTVELLKKMHEELNSEDYVYSSPDEFFKRQDLSGAPVIKEDLQFHAKGCYSAFSEIKKNNREAENALIEAEKASVLAGELVGTPCPQNDLTYAWERVLFNQFHDILGGCSIKEAYDDAREVHGEALSIASRLQNFAYQQISWNIDTMGGRKSGYVSEQEANEIGLPIVIFNTLEREIIAPVHFKNRNNQYFKRSENQFLDENGNPVPVQVVRDSKTCGVDDHYASLFLARVPAMGYVVYRARRGEEPTIDNPFTITENSVDNGELRLTFNEHTGELSSVIDHKSGRELLSAETGIELMDDTKNDTWAHGTVFFKDKINTPVVGSIKIIESGPVRATVRVKQTFGGSEMIRDYSLIRGARYIDVKAKIDFHEKHRVLKYTFPVLAKEARAVNKIPFGFIERPTDGSEQVCGDWIALFGNEGGLTISTDCKHSFDAEASVLSLTVLRSAIFADHYGVRDEFCEFMEQGEHNFRYRIAPFTSLADAERLSQELQNPPFMIAETFHEGALSTRYEGVSGLPENVTITAIKRHRQGEGIVVRAYENEGKDASVKAYLFGKELKFNLSHDQVKTLFISGDEVKEMDFLE